jgi:L-ribulose-5-phosphate 3-epimerase
MKPGHVGAEAVTLDLGAATYTYLYATDVLASIDRLAALGFRSCELMTVPPHLSPDIADASRRAEVRSRLEDRELELLAVQPGYLDLNLASTNDRIRAEAVAHLCDYVDLAADLGARFFVLGTGRRHPLIPAPLDWLYPRVVAGVARIVAQAERRGVVVTVENIPTHVVERADQLVALCEEIDSEACQGVYDVANGHMVEEPAEGLRTVAPYLAYVHLSDTGRDVWRHNRIGDGTVDFAAVAAELAAQSYDGPTVLEVLDPAEPDAALAGSAQALAALGWST